jgi:hypothetical protein
VKPADIYRADRDLIRADRDLILNRLMSAVIVALCVGVTAAWCMLLVWGVTLLISS